MTSIPQLEAEPRGAAAQMSLVGDPLTDNPKRNNNWKNYSSVSTSTAYDRTIRFGIPPQNSNVNPHSTSYDIDHGSNANLSRQTSVSHISNASYSGNPNPSQITTHINNNYNNGTRSQPSQVPRVHQQPQYSPYPATSIASTAIHNPQREVKIKTPSVSTDERERTKSTHSIHSSAQPFSSNHSKNSKDSLTSNIPKRNRLQEFLEFLRRNRRACCGLFCFIFVVAIIVAVVLCAVLIPNYQKAFSFQWAPPLSLRGSGVVEATGIKLTIDDSNEQARFDMSAHVPFKGNYVSVYDFKTKKAIIYDPSLKNGTKTLYCFVMSFGSDKLKDISELRKAAHNSQSLTSQTTGWEEQWHYVPQNVNNILQVSYVNPGIPECNGARLVELKSVGSNQKTLKCTDCFDFCFPEYGIENDLIQSQSKLNILNRMCFYFFVPEWQTFAQGYNINNVNPNLNNPQFSSYQFNGNVQNIPYSTNPQMGSNYGNGQFVGNPQSNQFNGNQNSQRYGGQGYNSNIGQFGVNSQLYPNQQQQQQQFNNGNGQSSNYNNGMGGGSIGTSYYNNQQNNNPQNGLFNQYNPQQNGQTNIVTRSNINNTHPESKWISVNPNSIVEQITNTTSNIWTGAKETFNAGVNQAQNVQETLGRGIQHVGSGIQSVGGGFQRFGSNIETGISDMRQTISSGIDSAGQGLQNFGQNARSNLQSFGQSVGQGVSDGVSNLQSGVADIHQQMRQQFNQMKQQNSVGPSYNTQSLENNDHNNVHYLLRNQYSGQNPQNNGNYLPNSQFDTSSQSINNFNNDNNNLSPGMAQFSQSNHNQRNPLAGY
uniref:BRICHOS domain-containing protein n=1 Tax=Strongyloides venezuelensis TaxID=75913 RepID=A0A0K0EUF6_STRVS